MTIVHAGYAFPPSRTNIPPFYSQRTPSIITTDTLMIIGRPDPTQPTPPNPYTPFEKGDLIPHTGSSTNLKPTYTSLRLRTSWSLTPYPTYSSSALQKSGMPNHVVFTTNSGRTKPHVGFPRQDNCMYQTTWSNSTNQLQFHSTKGYHDTLYGSNIPPLNNQVLATFRPSAIASAMN